MTVDRYQAGIVACRSASRAAGMFAGSCHLLVAAVRHRTNEVRRCMALAAAAARGLLTELLSWRAAGSADMAKQCAEDLASVYEAIAERKVTCTFSVVTLLLLRTYVCHLLLPCWLCCLLASSADGRFTANLPLLNV